MGMDPIDDRRALYRDTITLWQSRASQPLSDDDAREIIENISGFFEILIGWDQLDRDGDARSSARLDPFGGDAP